ncbi:MAG: hypothetical protein A2W91_06745 [Bacteroidetes bacterium GWF2_38_335]|nr:MAG: hypothetical protein A2W91_06745 [Bacteroidetes bacterium GWF2_38_335]OFY79851.1 MAG: hypothetical protein A2281_09335 [Bacteroidetes bacterium RIFOXYA12_FULL_38_20]HBS84914.1 hypothetical protein [Bacteroidales bacterium]
MKYFFVYLLFLGCLSFNTQGQCFSDCKYKLVNAEDQRDSLGNLDPLKIIEQSEIILKGLIGCQIPEFSLTTIDGKLISSSDLKGKIVVLNFWFTSCAPCVFEMPALNKLVENYSPDEVVFIAFSVDKSETIEKFLQKTSFNYQHISSGKDFLAEKFCIIFGYPTNMVFDKEGKLRQIFCGGSTDKKDKNAAFEKLKPVIDEWLVK